MLRAPLSRRVATVQNDLSHVVARRNLNSLQFGGACASGSGVQYRRQEAIACAASVSGD